MKIDGRRWDGSYSCKWAPAFLEAVGKVPEFLTGLYRAFNSRYPLIEPEAFGVPSGNRFSNVGATVALLDGRIKIEITVEKLSLEVERIRGQQELVFVQDCIGIAMDHAKGWRAVPGECNFQIATWVAVEGVEGDVSELLATRMPAIPNLDAAKFNAAKLISFPRLQARNDDEGWGMTMLVEPSASARNELFMLFNYAFVQSSKYNTLEAQREFIDRTSDIYLDWLGRTK